MSKRKAEYRTMDFYFACYLIYFGFKVTKLESKGARYEFTFGGFLEEEQADPAKEFYTHKAVVDPLKFKYSIQEMKSTIHDAVPAFRIERKNREEREEEKVAGGGDGGA